MSEPVTSLNLLGLCGSLRESSSNLRTLQAAQELLPTNATLTIFSSLALLPPFNPDVSAAANPQVQSWVDQMRDCDGLLVSSPVYAGGYPGSLKNALDWLVSTDAFVDKPFALLNATNRSLDVQNSLITVIETMSGNHIASATTALNLLGTHLSANDIIEDPIMAAALRDSLRHFVNHLRS